MCLFDSLDLAEDLVQRKEESSVTASKSFLAPGRARTFRTGTSCCRYPNYRNTTSAQLLGLGDEIFACSTAITQTSHGNYSHEDTI